MHTQAERSLSPQITLQTPYSSTLNYSTTSDFSLKPPLPAISCYLIRPNSLCISVFLPRTTRVPSLKPLSHISSRLGTTHFALSYSFTPLRYIHSVDSFERGDLCLP
jgi:hypothetical protein